MVQGLQLNLELFYHRLISSQTPGLEEFTHGPSKGNENWP